MNGEKKDSKSKAIKGLVVFKEEISPRIVDKEVISSEDIDQEDKIKLIHELKPFGANYRYTLLVVNQSQASISEVKIKVRFPKFVDLTRYSPLDCNVELLELEGGDKQVKVQAQKFEANSQHQFSFFLVPLSLESEGEVRSYLTFINNQDYVRALDSKPILIMFTPVTIERKILPTSQIKSFSEFPENKRAMRSIGIGVDNEFDPDTYFQLIKQVLEDQNYQLISNPEKNRIAWYFGTDLVSGKDILVVVQIVKNKVEWITVSNNPHIIVSVLTKLVNDFIVRLIFRQLIESPSQIYNLECKNCGAILSYFPSRGEIIKCDKCKTQQIVWN